MDFKFKDPGGLVFLIEGEFAYLLDKRGDVIDDCLVKHLSWSKYNPPGRFFKGNICLMFPGSLSGRKIGFTHEQVPVIEQLMELLPHNRGIDPYGDRMRAKAEQERQEKAAAQAAKFDLPETGTDSEPDKDPDE